MTREQIRRRIEELEAMQTEAARQDNDDRVYDLGCQISDLLEEVPED